MTVRFFVDGKELTSIGLLKTRGWFNSRTSDHLVHKSGARIDMKSVIALYEKKPWELLDIAEKEIRKTMVQIARRRMSMMGYSCCGVM